MADLEKLQDEVLQKLPLLTVEQLEECCTQLALPVPPAKKGKRTAIRSLVLTHLTSEDMEQDEDAVEVLTQMNGCLDKMVEGKLAAIAVVEASAEGEKKKQLEVKTEVPVVEQPTAGGVTTIKIELARFKEWKVSAGTFGGENHVDYCSLCYQIEEAKELRYTEKEIVSGMIKSMKNPLRKYCEGKMSWSLETLMTRIRSYAKVKDADKMLDDMKACSQEPTQTEIDFLTQMCTFRDNILAMTKQEEHPKNEATVKKKFFHALAVGFKKDTIRLMLAPVLKRGDLDDDELMKEVNDAVDADIENKKKTKGGKSAAANSLLIDSDVVEKVPVSSVPVSPENSLILQELAKLSGSLQELSGLKEHVKQLEGRVNNIFNSGLINNPLVQRFIKCKSCEDARVFCTHYALCGESGQRRDCPKNV